MQGRTNPKAAYDVIVVGGGVYGAAHAWEAASAGLRTLLIEREDYCSGASANSLKTIHGGVRYLQNLDFARVKESKREQALLLAIAPHLVHPLACIMPTDWSLTRNPLSMWIGFTLYKWIGDGDSRLTDKYGIISRRALTSEFPWLAEERANGGAIWYDAQVYNSERLVIDYIMSAQARGADVYNYRQAESAVVSQGRIREVSVRDRFTDEVFNVRAAAVIDTTGGWAEQAVAGPGRDAPGRYGRVRAVNLLFNKSISKYALGVRSAPETDKASGRLLFAAPWRGHTIVGTWYFPCVDSVDDDHITREEFEYCLADVQRSYVGFKVGSEDVTLVHMGTLPTKGSGGRAGDYDILLDKQEIVECEGADGGPTSVWIVPGIKYTTARAAAEKTVHRILTRLGRRAEGSGTRTQTLRGGDMDGRERYRKKMLDAHGECYGEVVVDRLLNEYGTTMEEIMRYAEGNDELAQLVPGTRDMLKAEVLHAIEVEQACTIGDVLIRRAGIGSIGMPDESTVTWCADFMAQHLGWGEAEKADAVEQLNRYFTRVVG